LKIFNTICDSTITRQLEAREIAAGVEAMIIIGGRNSANTRRLAKICQESGTRTIWVETASELQPQMVDGLESVGLTAGASTPKWIINEVVARLNVLTSRITRTGITLPAGR
jgi:4-hydroxy-3-methylbut-2-enyl diphosphate reductase